MEAILFAIGTFVSTLLGGWFGIKNRDRLHYIISFTAGVLIAVAFFDILPEMFNIVSEHSLNITHAMVAVVVGFFTQWLQWAPVTRVKFFHYIYTAIPFVSIALALILDRLWQWNKLGKSIAVLYLLAVIGMFIYWFPLLNGMHISDTYFRQHMWFKSWI